MKIRGVILLLAIAPWAGANTVLVESESFLDRGGWVLDAQFANLMGSPFLLAHGLGHPVSDAVATVAFPTTGVYRAWVRTRDWVPDHPDDPGRFKVSVDGTELPAEFGTGSGLWHWQDGGAVTVSQNQVELRLRDLTGFEGRCDAIAFCSDTNEVPPDGGTALAAWRLAARGESADPPTTDRSDFVVVGGGLAGCAAAIAASRGGCDVVLIQDRPVLGGNASDEVRIATLGVVRHAIVESLRNKAGNSSPNAALYDALRLAAVTNEPRVRLFTGWQAYGVVTNGTGRIAAVDARRTDTGERRRFAAPLFADCTGDGWIGYWAGASFRMGREARAEFGESLAPTTADSMTMGNSLQWSSSIAAEPSAFPEVPWAVAVAGTASATDGNWTWEYGMWRDTVHDAEAIRDHLFRAIYGNFYNAKQKAGNENLAFDWMPYVAGKRESRRLAGDHVLDENDVRNHVFFEDAVAMESREIDIHFPVVSTGYISYAVFTPVEPYYIPFRSLYSRDVPNLMMAGRCFSCTHVGLGSPRVMHTGGQMGVAVGYAAALCKLHGLEPRDLYRRGDRTLELQALIGGAWPERPPTFTALVDNSQTNLDVTVVGDWTASASNTGYWNTDYLHDGNAGKGTKSVCFTPSLPDPGPYRVLVRWAAAENRSTNTPVLILTNAPPPVAPRDAPYIRTLSSSNTVFNTHETLTGRVQANEWIRGLLDFDLSVVPDDATIHSVELALTINTRDTGSGSDTVGAEGLRLYRLTEDFTGSQVTWNSRRTGVPWTRPGGTFDTNPVSVIASPKNPSLVAAGDTIVFPGSGAFVDAVRTGLAADWLGLAVRTPSLETSFNLRKLYRFCSETHTNAGWRPRLTIAYTAPGLDGVVTQVVNQTANGGAWNDLGTYTLATNRMAHVVIRTEGTADYVIADAVGFLRPGVSDDDLDGDGLPNWWERYHFLGETLGDPDADPDGDGMNTRQEFYTDTDPIDPRSRFSVGDLFNRPAAGDLVLHWHSATGRTYRLESTDDLAHPFEPLATGLPATPPQNTHTVTVDRVMRHFRVIAE